MNNIDIQARLAIIKSLPLSELDKRQPLLVELVADIVNSETCDGNDTDSSTSLEYQEWWCSLGCLMRDAGFRMLGNGHFSAAYSHEMLSGRVIKVGFKKEDSGAAYTAFCRMHQGRAGIPNVYHVARHAGCYTVVLDRLHFMAIRRELGVIDRNERRAEMLMGSAWHDFWLHNGNATVRKIDQVNGLKWQLGDHLAIQAGRPLNIDKVLDAKLMG